MPDPRLTVWYNTRCPVCDAGIDRQRNKLVAVVAAGTIAFRDINLEPGALAAYGASLEDIRRRLHATDDAGRLLVGADVAIAIWRLTPGESWLAALAGNPVVRPLTRFVYDRFARPALRLEPAQGSLVKTARNRWLRRSVHPTVATLKRSRA